MRASWLLVLLVCLVLTDAVQRDHLSQQHLLLQKKATKNSRHRVLTHEGSTGASVSATGAASASGAPAPATSGASASNGPDSEYSFSLRSCKAKQGTCMPINDCLADVTKKPLPYGACGPVPKTTRCCVPRPDVNVADDPSVHKCIGADKKHFGLCIPLDKCEEANKARPLATGEKSDVKMSDLTGVGTSSEPIGTRFAAVAGRCAGGSHLQCCIQVVADKPGTATGAPATSTGAAAATGGATGAPAPAATGVAAPVTKPTAHAPDATAAPPAPVSKPGLLQTHSHTHSHHLTYAARVDMSLKRRDPKDGDAPVDKPVDKPVDASQAPPAPVDKPISAPAPVDGGKDQPTSKDQPAPDQPTNSTTPAVDANGKPTTPEQAPTGKDQAPAPAQDASGKPQDATGKPTDPAPTGKDQAPAPAPAPAQDASGKPQDATGKPAEQAPTGKDQAPAPAPAPAQDASTKPQDPNTKLTPTEQAPGGKDQAPVAVPDTTSTASGKPTEPQTNGTIAATSSTVAPVDGKPVSAPAPAPASDAKPDATAPPAKDAPPAPPAPPSKPAMLQTHTLTYRARVDQSLKKRGPKDGAPVDKGGDSAPVGKGADQAPVGKGGDQAPVSKDGATSEDDGKEQGEDLSGKPGTSKDQPAPAPAPVSKDQAPATGKDQATPAPAPAPASKDQATTTPAPPAKDAPPAPADAATGATGKPTSPDARPTGSAPGGKDTASAAPAPTDQASGAAASGDVQPSSDGQWLLQNLGSPGCELKDACSEPTIPFLKAPWVAEAKVDSISFKVLKPFSDALVASLNELKQANAADFGQVKFKAPAGICCHAAKNEKGEVIPAVYDRQSWGTVLDAEVLPPSAVPILQRHGIAVQGLQIEAGQALLQKWLDEPIIGDQATGTGAAPASATTAAATAVSGKPTDPQAQPTGTGQAPPAPVDKSQAVPPPPPPAQGAPPPGKPTA